MNKALFFQIMRFGIVGVLASLVHFSCVVLFVHFLHWLPLVANVVGFSIGVQVSYWGHRSFTFRGTEATHAVAYPRLVLMQAGNFLANEGLFFFFLSMHLPYPIALLIVLAIMPMFTFVISKTWVFA